MTQTPEIAGYTSQTKTSVSLVNENKLLEELVLRQLDRQKDMPDLDQRLNAMAFTYFQIGFMLMNRAVFQPTRIEGEIVTDALIRDLSA